MQALLFGVYAGVIRFWGWTLGNPLGLVLFWEFVGLFLCFGRSFEAVVLCCFLFSVFFLSFLGWGGEFETLPPKAGGGGRFLGNT